MKTNQVRYTQHVYNTQFQLEKIDDNKFLYRYVNEGGQKVSYLVSKKEAALIADHRGMSIKFKMLME